MSLIGFYALFMCVCARHGVDTGHGQNPERVGAIVCIWVVRLPLWLTNNGNWPCRAGPGWGRVGSVAIATGQDTQDDTAPTALSGLPRAAKPPTARRTGALNFPARRKRESVNIHGPVTSSTGFLCASVSEFLVWPHYDWKIEHLAPTLWILKQFYACHFAFWIGHAFSSSISPSQLAFSSCCAVWLCVGFHGNFCQAWLWFNGVAVEKFGKFSVE